MKHIRKDNAMMIVWHHIRKWQYSKLCFILVSCIASIITMGTFPETYTMDEHGIAQAPPTFKYQAKVSQASMPVGDALIQKIHVNLIGYPTNQRCYEDFRSVHIDNSVINLVIGNNINNGCTLQELMRANKELHIQLCIGDGTNCMPAVRVGAVPYAFVVNEASYAYRAAFTEKAALSHYTHRTASQNDVEAAGTSIPDHFDFATPPGETTGIISFYDSEQSNYDVLICADSQSWGHVPINELFIDALETEVTSSLIVGDGTPQSGSFSGNAISIGQGPVYDKQLAINDTLSVSSLASLTGPSTTIGDSNDDVLAVASNTYFMNNVDFSNTGESTITFHNGVTTNISHDFSLPLIDLSCESGECVDNNELKNNAINLQKTNYQLTEYSYSGNTNLNNVSIGIHSTCFLTRLDLSLFGNHCIYHFIPPNSWTVSVHLASWEHCTITCID